MQTGVIDLGSVVVIVQATVQRRRQVSCGVIQVSRPPSKDGDVHVSDGGVLPLSFLSRSYIVLVLSLIHI